METAFTSDSLELVWWVSIDYFCKALMVGSSSPANLGSEGLRTDEDDDEENLAEAETGEETWAETEAENGSEDIVVDWRFDWIDRNWIDLIGIELIW